MPNLREIGPPLNVCLYGLSSVVVDLGDLPEGEIIPLADLRTNDGYRLQTLNCPISEDEIGDALADAVDGLDFGNQPAGDSVTVESDSASDIGVVVTVYGMINGTQVVKVGTATIAAASTAVDLTLEDGTAVTDWGVVLGVECSAALVGTLTVKEKSGGQTITTLAAGATSKGVTDITDVALGGLPVQAVADGASTKYVGVVGENAAGTEVCDALQLAGTTAVNGRVGIVKATKLLHGDAASATAVTFGIGNLSWQAGEPLTDLGAGDHGRGRVRSHRYLHACLANGTDGTVTGGEHDWLKIYVWR